MSTGFATALGEITLVLFTTLAPSGALAFVLMGAALLREQGEARVRINRFLIVPIFVSLIGLVASATHLGNPDNALYVFTQVGHSPLSNEVFAAVVFMGLAGVYWLYQFADRANSRVQRAWLVVAMVSAVAFVAAVAFAYAGRTIVTWNTPFVPVALCLNALVGGPVLAVAGLHAANWEPAARGFGRTMVAASGVALRSTWPCMPCRGWISPAWRTRWVPPPRSCRSTPPWSSCSRRCARSGWRWRACRCSVERSFPGGVQPQPRRWCTPASSSCASLST